MESDKDVPTRRHEAIDMSSKTELPLGLFKANLELQARINRLVQQGGQQWLDFGNRLLGDGIAESNAEIDELLKTGDWQTLATLPAESFWRQLQQRFGDNQAAAQIAINAQTAFATGLQEAVQAWQKETAESLATLSGTGGVASGAWGDAIKQWGVSWPAPSTAADKPAARGGTRGK